MFRFKKSPAIRTLIGEGTVFRGELRFSDGLQIDGEVIGDIYANEDRPSMLIISEKARITGKIRAGHVVINGTINGPVTSDELLELQSKAKILGDVKYEALEMHQGAAINGQLIALRAAEDKPNLKLAVPTPMVKTGST